MDRVGEDQRREPGEDVEPGGERLHPVREPGRRRDQHRESGCRGEGRRAARTDHHATPRSVPVAGSKAKRMENGPEPSVVGTIVRWKRRSERVTATLSRSVSTRATGTAAHHRYAWPGGVASARRTHGSSKPRSILSGEPGKGGMPLMS